MTIEGNPKRVPRKEKKRMGKEAYDLLMKYENTIWRNDVRIDFRGDEPKRVHYGHNIFMAID